MYVWVVHYALLCDGVLCISEVEGVYTNEATARRAAERLKPRYTQVKVEEHLMEFAGVGIDALAAVV